MKKALLLASVASMIEQFNMENIRLLKKMGYDVDVVANFEHGSTMPYDMVNKFKEDLIQKGINVIHSPIPRKTTDIKGIIGSLKQIRKLCKANQYSIIHCHSPIGGVIARLAALKNRRSGANVIYTAHGFHFYKGGPLSSWLIYFPVEWLCSFLTDTLITINQEDYRFARKYMKAKNIAYIPGVGIDTEKIENITVDKYKKLKELGISEDKTVVLSVGELNDNKNHEVIIKALAKLDNKNIVYLICGRGNKKEYLQSLADKLGVALILAGYRQDIIEIYKVCDIFAFPSKREGLGLAALEAMASGLPLISSATRGACDYVFDGVTGFMCHFNDDAVFANNIKKLLYDNDLKTKISLHNKEEAKRFDKSIVMEITEGIYSSNSYIEKQTV